MPPAVNHTVVGKFPALEKVCEKVSPPNILALGSPPLLALHFAAPLLTIDDTHDFAHQDFPLACSTA